MRPRLSLVPGMLVLLSLGWSRQGWAKTVEEEISPYVQEDSAELIRLPDGSATEEYNRLSPKAKAAYLDYYDSETDSLHTVMPFVGAGLASGVGIWGYVYYSAKAATDGTSKFTKDEVSQDNMFALLYPVTFGLLAAWTTLNGISDVRTAGSRNRASRNLRGKIGDGDSGKLEFEIQPRLASSPGLELSIQF